MADSSCGPSNAFKGLARRIEQDRSHQQDRVTPGPQHPVQGFRSGPLNTGLPDQFGAFQQQNATLPQHPSIGLNPYEATPYLPSHSGQTPVGAAFFSRQPAQQRPAFATTTGDSWVTDFERMAFDAHVRPHHAQTIHGPAMGHPGVANPMHSNIVTPALRHQPPLQPFQPPPIGLHPISQQVGMFQSNNNIPAPSLSDAVALSLDAQKELLDQEFEDAMDQWMLQNGPGAETSDHNELNAQESERLDGNSTAPAESTDNNASEKDTAENRDELARAAQQLVNSLADNNSEKFKNSDFLALMRRIASQELTVQGNDLVETQPSRDGGLDSHITGATSAAATESDTDFVDTNSAKQTNT
ncbi:hypothetical protein GGR55DRAFT_677992 [Xylaria sp. FL0064]|nr:hypothetical protein GGR55DRAFT_677992 [Xylaria sp. FL0064]